jgi:hypothetical protein
VSERWFASLLCASQNDFLLHAFAPLRVIGSSAAQRAREITQQPVVVSEAIERAMERQIASPNSGRYKPAAMQRDEPPDDEPLELMPRPAPSPQEIARTSTSTKVGAWTAKTLAGWGVPHPPPKGWRTELIHLHALGLDVTPLPYRPKDRRIGKAEQAASSAPSPSSAAITQPMLPQQWSRNTAHRITDIGTPDPDDPPPWL